MAGLLEAGSYVFSQYGNLKHLPALDDPAAVNDSDMAAVVSAAIAVQEL
jgi:hypothetical protein